jgi:hypothetical protein
MQTNNSTERSGPPKRTLLQKVVKVLLIAWTFPNTVLGILIGGLGIVTGGKFQIIGGCLEFHGGIIKSILSKNRIAAMTLGHTIIGQTPEEMRIVRKHEQAHVRQYERWGPFFIPAYLLCSLYLIIRGREYYRNNPFEIEAYEIDDPSNYRDRTPDDDRTDFM